uniref:Ywhaz n=1 Tax=Mesocricetus auratus TaxID=10036 RepID=Q6Q0M5_MESAU|nr:Ywhaz [Mesocricetus auratus]
MTGLCYFYLNFYISHVVFMFNIRGVEPVNFRELLVFILRWPIWGSGIFTRVTHVWHSTFVHCGFRRARVKTASMSKQRKLPTYWFVLVGIKG